jgi:hypothetical protein
MLTNNKRTIDVTSKPFSKYINNNNNYNNNNYYYYSNLIY